MKIKFIQNELTNIILLYLDPWNLIYKTIFTFTQLLGANYHFSTNNIWTFIRNKIDSKVIKEYASVFIQDTLYISLDKNKKCLKRILYHCSINSIKSYMTYMILLLL